MNNDDSLLLAVIIVAFVAGYAAIGFLVNRVKAGMRSLRLGEPQTGRTSPGKAGSGCERNEAEALLRPRYNPGEASSRPEAHNVLPGTDTSARPGPEYT